MSFYLRKAFTRGPIRLNLSRGGPGLSVGVRGARLGLTPGGRVYTHVGRYGLYSRTYLGSTGKTAGGKAATGEPIVLEEATDVMYTASGSGDPEPSPPPPLEERLQRRKHPICPYLLFLPAGLILFALGDSPSTTGSPAAGVLRGVSFLALVAGAVLMIRAARRNRRGRALGRRLRECLAGPTPPTEPEKAALAAALRDPAIHPADREYQCRAAYLQLLRRVIEDRVVTDAEAQRLADAERLLSIDPEFADEARLQIFREVALEAVADHELTPEEESTLEQIRTRLEVPSSEIESELEMIERLETLRAIRAGALPEVDPDISLRRSETCHFAGEGRFVKTRIVRSFQREGRKYKVRGWVIDREGRLLITNQRILLVHAGTSSIPMNRILHLELDYDRNLITITRDGAARPVYLTTPDAPRVAAIIAVSAGM